MTRSVPPRRCCPECFECGLGAPPLPRRLTRLCRRRRVQSSKWAKTGRNLQLQIMKKDQEEEEHWPRITKEKVKLQWLQTDWSRFVDEDEEDGADSEMSALPRPPPLRLRRPHTAASERRAQT